MGPHSLFNSRGEQLHRLMTFLVVIPSFLAMGFSNSFLGGVVSYRTFYSLFPIVDTATTNGAQKAHNALMSGVIVATYNLGGFVGSLSCISLGDRLGRRNTTLLGTGILFVATVLHCSAFQLAQLIVGRFGLGVGVGITTSTVPVWQAETSRTHKRGSHVIIDGICIAGGIAMASWCTFGFSKVETTGAWQWRVPCMATGLFALFVGVWTPFFPESPRWLALKGRQDEARQVLAIMEATTVDDPQVEADLAAVNHVNDDVAESAGFLQLFRYGKEKLLYRVLLALSAQWYSQMNGAALITYYSNQLFEAIGLGSEKSRIVGAGALTFKFVCCFIAFYTIEVAGRRRLFIIAGAGMAVCMFVVGICGSQTTDEYLRPAYVSIAFIFIFLIFLPIGYLGPNFLYVQEVITTRYRASVSGIATAIHYLSAFAVALSTPLGFEALGYRYYFIWAASALSIVPVVYFFYPETTDLTIEQVDQIFIDSPTLLGVVKLASQRRREVRRSNAGVGIAGLPEGKESREEVP